MGSRHKYTPASWIDNWGPFLDTVDTEKTAVGFETMGKSEMMGRSKVYMWGLAARIAFQPFLLTNHQSFFSTFYPFPLHIY